MSAGTIVAIVVVVIIVAALIAGASLAARRRRLRQRFGPEYDRAVEGSDSRLRAEAELASRERRVRHLDIRPLDPAARAAYQGQWTAIQQQFVDTPAEAVTAAQTLITGVMSDRGYPTEDESQIMDDLSVDHAATIGRFRTAQDICARAADGSASTEDLRQAMIHYRVLFEDLLGDPAELPRDATEPVAPVPASTEPASTEPASTEPASTAPASTVPPGGTSAAGSVVSEDSAAEYSAAEYDVPAPAEAPDPGDVVPGGTSRGTAGRDSTSPDDPGLDEQALDEPTLDAPDLDAPDLDAPDLDDQAEPAAASRLPWRR
jgi:hypothetical protein